MRGRAYTSLYKFSSAILPACGCLLALAGCTVQRLNLVNVERFEWQSEAGQTASETTTNGERNGEQDEVDRAAERIIGKALGQ